MCERLPGLTIEFASQRSSNGFKEHRIFSDQCLFNSDGRMVPLTDLQFRAMSILGGKAPQVVRTSDLLVELSRLTGIKIEGVSGEQWVAEEMYGLHKLLDAVGNDSLKSVIFGTNTVGYFLAATITMKETKKNY